MTAAEALHRLRRIRREVQDVLAAAPPPALAQTMREMDRAAHLAAWQIGEATSLIAESDLPAAPRSTPRRDRKRQRRQRRGRPSA